MFCTSCGAPLVDGAVFCEQCGSKVQSEDAPQEQPVLPVPRKRSEGPTSLEKVCIGVGVACAAALAVGVGALVLGSFPEHTEQEPSREAVAVVDNQASDKRDDAQEEQQGEDRGTSPSKSEPSPAYEVYRNVRFGYSMELPSTCSKVSEPANLSGAEFHDPDTGMTVTFWGSNNPTDFSVKQAYEQDAKGHDVSYSCVEDDFCVVSYVENGMVVYVKQYVGALSSCGVKFEYPQASKATCDAQLERMVETFVPGNLDQAN